MHIFNRFVVVYNIQIVNRMLKSNVIDRALSNSAATPNHPHSPTHPHPPPPTQNIFPPTQINALYSPTHPHLLKIMSHPPKTTHTHSK